MSLEVISFEVILNSIGLWSDDTVSFSSTIVNESISSMIDFSTNMWSIVDSGEPQTDCIDIKLLVFIDSVKILDLTETG